MRWKRLTTNSRDKRKIKIDSKKILKKLELKMNC